MLATEIWSTSNALFELYPGELIRNAVPGVAAGCHGAIPHSKPPFLINPLSPEHAELVVVVVVGTVVVGTMVVGVVVGFVVVDVDTVVVGFGLQRQAELNLDGLDPQAAEALEGKPVEAVLVLNV